MKVCHFWWSAPARPTKDQSTWRALVDRSIWIDPLLDMPRVHIRFCSITSSISYVCDVIIVEMCPYKVTNLQLRSKNVNWKAGGIMQMCGSADVTTCKMRMLMRMKIRILPTLSRIDRSIYGNLIQH